MKNIIIPLDQIQKTDRRRVGGKAYALARMAAAGFRTPRTLSLVTDAYQYYVDETGLRGRITLELNRKPFDQMRWEEIWDAALRIRNLFLRTSMPDPLASAITAAVETEFKRAPVVVRSSGVAEDSAQASFAGLHDSFVNIQGAASVREHVRLVWASLWSDRALLYRKELGLDIHASAMGVVVQEIVVGECSGVIFSRSPNDPDQAVIEAVYGLNQGLVDGDIDPDRWILDRSSRTILTHTAPNRQSAMRPSEQGVHMAPLSADEKNKPPLTPDQIKQLFAIARDLETMNGGAQDVEWTIRQGCIHVLQSRPVTTGGREDSQDDPRAWYLSQHRTFENLKALCHRVEFEWLPQMARETDQLAQTDPEQLDDHELAHEMNRRFQAFGRWKKIYWDEFIPLAHGIRLFGQVYNDKVRPENPFEFQDLLVGSQMLSLKRNRMIAEMVAMLRRNPDMADAATSNVEQAPQAFKDRLDAFIQEFGEGAWGASLVQGREAVVRMLTEMAKTDQALKRSHPKEIKDLEKRYLEAFGKDQREQARQILQIGRDSYRLRDDDNIYFGRIEGQMHKFAAEARKRIARSGRQVEKGWRVEDIARVLIDPSFIPTSASEEESASIDAALRARQIVGQPAGPGVARGRARLVMNADQLLAFQSGEILVCDAVDPNMTFVVPLAAAVVERRGGMLIHGAIIAREYGIPCVTGAPDVAQWIQTGDEITVDGFLGIVIRHSQGV